MRCSADLAAFRLSATALLLALGLGGATAYAQAHPVAQPAAPLRTPAVETCVNCHAVQQDARLHDPMERLRGSVHAHAIGCSGCHGGRGNEPTAQAHDPEAGFVPRPDAATIANRCGSCHADARFIRRFREDLPTDQLALYYSDAHGRAVAEGNASAPSCLDCHGSHDIQSPSDPSSRVARRHVHETCGRCHADPAHMAGTRLPTNQMELWTHSVHGVAVLEHGNPRAPTCAGCHGAHGEYRDAGGPEGRCRQCHTDEAAAFDRSPHAAAYRRLGFSGCVACHGSHDIQRANGALGTVGGMGVCRRCHGEGRSSYDLARGIAGDAEDARQSLAAARSEVQALERDGLRVPALNGMLEEAEQADVQLRVAVHALDATVTRAAAAAVREPAQRARTLARSTRDRDRRSRHMWLLAVPVLGLFIALAALKLRAVERAKGGPG